MVICRDDLKDRSYIEYQKAKKTVKKELKQIYLNHVFLKKLKYMSLFSCYLPSYHESHI